MAREVQGSAIVGRAVELGRAAMTAAATPPTAAYTGTPANERALERGLGITNPAPANTASGGDLAAAGSWAPWNGSSPSSPRSRCCRARPMLLRRRLPLQGRHFTFARVQELCAKRSPETGARFNFWHPDLVTLHVWLWCHNPDGLYNGTNPLVRPFNR